VVAVAVEGFDLFGGEGAGLSQGGHGGSFFRSQKPEVF
jgi:hypothetical protein